MNDREKDLESLFHANGFEWALQMFSPRENAAAYFLERLDKLDTFMGSRNLGNSGPTLEVLHKLTEHSPFKAAAFFEALVAIRSSEILCAAWRVIQGMSIENLSVAYEHLQTFRLVVSLRSPYGEAEVYESHDIDDLAFMRHLSKCKSGGKPLLNGFHALRQKPIGSR